MSNIKNTIISFCILCCMSAQINFADSTTSIMPSVVVQSANYQSTTTTVTNSDGTTSTKTIDPGPAIASMEQYVVSYPAKFTAQQDDGSWVATQSFTNRTSKNMVPPGYKSGLQGGSFTFLSLQGDLKAPSGSSIFSLGSSSSSGTVSGQALDDSSSVSLSTISSEFDSLISTLQSNTAFVKFFRKVHLNILNELYEYLMNIYTNFNLHHPGSSLADDGSLSISIPDYISAEETYAMNIKTLIVNHLVNLIEEQFNSSVQAMMPNVPELFATKIGKTTILSDYSVDITNFILTDISSDLEDLQTAYLDAFKQYLTFFQDYTSLISTADDSTGFSQFCSVAENINNILTSTDADSDVANMNPQMFFYDTNTMRALRVIPDLAKKLPSGVQSIGWPDTLVTAATEKYILTVSGTSHPVAYFTDANGNIVTSEAQASHLYAIIQSGADYFQEEVLKQPDWLNTEEGVLNILRACMGDFTAILEMDVLDCCMETLINNALNETSTSSSDIATTCEDLINSWSDNVVTDDDGSTVTVSTPTVSTPTVAAPTISAPGSSSLIG